MLVIADNITTRIDEVDKIFREAEAGDWIPCEGDNILMDLALQCARAGADVLEINLQQHHDKPEAMEYAVRVVQQATDLQLCLSSNHGATLEAGLKGCKRPPIVNYLSIEEERLKRVLPVVAGHKAEVVLLVSDPAHPTDAAEMLQKAAILIGAANAAGIPNERILLDPGLIHIASEVGPRHLTEVMTFLRGLSDAAEPPVRSTCWLNNISTGAAKKLRPVIEATLLPMLAGAGLSSVFMDVLQKDNMRSACLIRVFRNQEIYSDGLLEP